MMIGEGKVVSFHYTLTGEDGEVLDSSSGAEPLLYLHGHRNIIAGLEAELDGKRVGEEFVVELAPQDAYGERDEALVVTIPRSSLVHPGELEPGLQTRARIRGEERIVTVQEIDGEQVTIDGNHPLAGEQLRFEVEVKSVREATEEELAHGHVHAHGGHSH